MIGGRLAAHAEELALCAATCPHGFPPACETEWEDDGPPHTRLLCLAEGWLCRYPADDGHTDHAPYVEGEYLRRRDPAHTTQEEQ